MAKHICIYCRTRMSGKGNLDPYLCNNCESFVKKAQLSERFAYIGNYN